jgi:hypothetical protein
MMCAHCGVICLGSTLSVHNTATVQYSVLSVQRAAASA